MTQASQGGPAPEDQPERTELQASQAPLESAAIPDLLGIPDPEDSPVVRESQVTMGSLGLLVRKALLDSQVRRVRAALQDSQELLEILAGLARLVTREIRDQTEPPAIPDLQDFEVRLAKLATQARQAELVLREIEDQLVRLGTQGQQGLKELQEALDGLAQPVFADSLEPRETPAPLATKASQARQDRPGTQESPARSEPARPG